MNGIALNSDNFLQDNAEVLALWFSAGKGSGDVFPHKESGTNKQSWLSISYICISHLLYDADLLHKKAGTRTGKSGSRSGDGEALVIPKFGITKVIPNKEDIPKFTRKPL